MTNFYHIFIVNTDGKAKMYIDTVKSTGATKAELDCQKRFGKASNYTGNGSDQFVAIIA